MSVRVKCYIVLCLLNIMNIRTSDILVYQLFDLWNYTFSKSCKSDANKKGGGNFIMIQK